MSTTAPQITTVAPSTPSTPTPPTPEQPAYYYEESTSDGGVDVIHPRMLSGYLNPQWLPTLRFPHDGSREDGPVASGSKGPQRQANWSPSIRYEGVTQRSYSKTQGEPDIWFSRHLKDNLRLKRMARMPQQWLNKTLSLVDELVNDVETLDVIQEGQSAHPTPQPGSTPQTRAKPRNPWDPLWWPDAISSESQLSLMYGVGFLRDAALHALSLLLAWYDVPTVAGRLSFTPPIITTKVNLSPKTTPLDHNPLRCMIHLSSTPAPDVLVSLSAQSSRFMTYGHPVRQWIGLKNFMVAPGLGHLAVGETNMPVNIDDVHPSSKNPLLLLPPENEYYELQAFKCGCTGDGHSQSDHNADLNRERGDGSLEERRERLLYEVLESSSMQAAAAAVKTKKFCVNSTYLGTMDLLLHQVWRQMVCFGVLAGWCTNWLGETRLMIRIPSKQTIYMSTPLVQGRLMKAHLRETDVMQEAKERILAGDYPYDVGAEKQKDNQSALKGMVAAILLGFHIRMRECGTVPELGRGQWFVDVTKTERASGEAYMKRLAGDLKNKYSLHGLPPGYGEEDSGGGGESGDQSGSGSGSRSGSGNESESGGSGGGGGRQRGKASGKRPATWKDRDTSSKRTRRDRSAVDDLLESTGQAWTMKRCVDELHVRFSCGILQSCHPDVFHLVEEEATESSPSLTHSAGSHPSTPSPLLPFTPMDSSITAVGAPVLPVRVGSRTLSGSWGSWQGPFSPPSEPWAGSAKSTPREPLSSMRLRSQSPLQRSGVDAAQAPPTAIALCITGLLGCGQTYVLRVEANVPGEGESGAESRTMAFKISMGAVGLTSLLAEYKVYKTLQLQTSIQPFIPKAYGVYWFDFGHGLLVSGLLLSCEPGVPAWNLPPDRLLKLYPRVTEVVEALHASGIVHGDLGAHNILVEEKDDGTDVVRLVDFEHAVVTREKIRQTADLEALMEMFQSCEAMDMSD